MRSGHGSSPPQFLVALSRRFPREIPPRCRSGHLDDDDEVGDKQEAVVGLLDSGSCLGLGGSSNDKAEGGGAGVEEEGSGSGGAQTPWYPTSPSASQSPRCRSRSAHCNSRTDGVAGWIFPVIETTLILIQIRCACDPVGRCGMYRLITKTEEEVPTHFLGFRSSYIPAGSRAGVVHAMLSMRHHGMQQELH